MSKILIDKNRLKTIRDNIDYLLENGKQNFVIDTRPAMYEYQDLNKREQIIIEHLNKNPDINKEKLASDLKDHYSRIPILKTTNELIEKGIVIAKEDKIKKRTYHLYVNYQNTISSLKQDLDHFKYFYCELLDYANPIIKDLLSKHQKSENRFLEALNLVYALIAPYKYLCILHTTSDVFLWHKRPLDDDTLHRKFALFLETTKQIHAKLLEMWPDSKFESNVAEIMYNSPFRLNELSILCMLETFEEYGLSDWCEPVIDLLWKLNYAILPLVDPLFMKYAEKGIIGDWRKILENNPQSNYKPKTEQLPFD